MNADEKSAFNKDYRGRFYYFCSKGCEQTFTKNSGKFG
ncbi:MAG: YHS domain-containing protein [Candidatus Aenigmarchaeota archaeon]|nr:YHS domain-containing protein [Candidatus Aenigmarchaeota archaeon]